MKDALISGLKAKDANKLIPRKVVVLDAYRHASMRLTDLFVPNREALSMSFFVNPKTNFMISVARLRREVYQSRCQGEGRR